MFSPQSTDLRVAGPAVRRVRRLGFSLIELLVVIAILGVLAVFAVPAVQSIGAARGLPEGAYQVSALFERARAEAVGRGTYVWAGVQPATNAGRVGIRLGMGYSTNGKPQISAFRPLGRAEFVDGVSLTNFSSLTPTTYSGSAPADIATNSGALIQVGNVNFSDGRVVTFTPRGEVLMRAEPTDADGFEPLIGVALIQTRGGTGPANALEAGITLDGSTGLPRVHRQ